MEFYGSYLRAFSQEVFEVLICKKSLKILLLKLLSHLPGGNELNFNGGSVKHMLLVVNSVTGCQWAWNQL